MALPWLLGQGARPGLEVVALSAYLTYTLHALIWTAFATGLERLRSLSSRARSIVWSLALFAPLATTSLALAWPLDLESGARAPSMGIGWLSTAAPLLQAPAPASEPWTTLGRVIAWSALLGLLRWLLQALRLSRSLRARTAVRDRRWLERLERLQRRTGVARVTLSRAPRAASALVLGTSHICLSSEVLGLEDAEIDSVLAHELAHVERGDGLWFPLTGLVASVLWLQPLAARAAARFRQAAEHACDDRAVELTQDARGLARVLVRLAGAASARPSASLAPSMAQAKGALFLRIERLTADPRRENGGKPRWAAWVAGWGSLGLGLLSAPVSVRIATASALAASASATSAPELATSPAPGVAAASSVMIAFARQERDVADRLRSIEALPEAQSSGSPSAVRLLELGQELRHLQQTQQWLEERSLAQQSRQSQAGVARP